MFIGYILIQRARTEIFLIPLHIMLWGFPNLADHPWTYCGEMLPPHISDRVPRVRPRSYLPLTLRNVSGRGRGC